MSGTQAKKKSGAERREARALQEQKEKRKIRIITISVVVVLAVLFLGALLVNSKYLRRVMTVVTVGGKKFTATDFDYFYKTVELEYQQMLYEQMGDYYEEMLPSTDRPHKSQIYDEETGKTWADVYGDMAIGRMKELVAYYNDAMQNGYELTEEALATVDADIENMRYMAEMYGHPTLDSLLAQVYGGSMNEKAYREVSTFTALVSAYAVDKYNSFTYSPAQLSAYYDEEKDMLDIFEFRYFLVYADKVDEDDFDSDEAYEAAKEEAQAESLAKARGILAGVETEEDFVAAAREYDEDTYAEDASTFRDYQGDWLGSIYGPWLREPQRVREETTTAESTSGTYAVMFLSRDNNDYKMPEMRQLLTLRDEVDPDDYYDDEQGYAEALAEADESARTWAESVFDMFIRTGGTEETLITMLDNSDDDREGGFYDRITRYTYDNRMVSEVDEWLFDPERKPGDSELVETEAYGYHILYFVGWGDRYCDFLAEGRMRERDFKEWNESLEQAEPKESWAMILTRW
ncbi:MAG: peptidylprolyl isomerase [Oscillospiraceae bacterium]|nr:peptidylprolyl isomerase [Oscillospiraceae bacterium]